MNTTALKKQILQELQKNTLVIDALSIPLAGATTALILKPDEARLTSIIATTLSALGLHFGLQYYKPKLDEINRKVYQEFGINGCKVFAMSIIGGLLVLSSGMSAGFLLQLGLNPPSFSESTSTALVGAASYIPISVSIASAMVLAKHLVEHSPKYIDATKKQLNQTSLPMLNWLNSATNNHTSEKNVKEKKEDSEINYRPVSKAL